MNRATIKLDIHEPDIAAAAISPDDEGSIEVTVDNGLTIIASSESPMGLLRTIDDVMGCLRATGIE